MGFGIIDWHFTHSLMQIRVKFIANLCDWRNILYLLSHSIKAKKLHNIYDDPYKAIADLAKMDIIIACDNLTAQVAILLGKYVIIIASQRWQKYRYIKHEKCIIVNINDKNLYKKIGKAYHKFIKSIKQSVHDYNIKQYNNVKDLPYQQLYQNALIFANDNELQIAVWLLEDIPHEYYNAELLSCLLKVYYQNKNYHKYIEILELFEDKIKITPNHRIIYLHFLMAIKKYSRLEQEIYRLYKDKLFIQNDVKFLTMKNFAFFLYQFGLYDEFEIFVNEMKSYAPKDFTKLIDSFLAYIKSGYTNIKDYTDIKEYDRLILNIDEYKHIIPLWTGSGHFNALKIKYFLLLIVIKS